MKIKHTVQFTILIAIPLLAITAMRPLAPTAPNGTIITVTTTVDEYDEIANENCSLREAIQSANDDADFGGCLGTGVYGEDTIILGNGIYNVNRKPEPPTYEDSNLYGDLDIITNGITGTDSFDITIEGNGPGNTILDAGYVDRVIDIQADANVWMQGVDIQSGYPPPWDGKNGDGCGLYNLGSLVIENSRIHENLCWKSRQFTADLAPRGGGVYSAGDLTLEDSVIFDNVAGESGNGVDGGNGGGVYIETGSGMVQIVNTEISGNAAGAVDIGISTGNGGKGGGIYNAGGNTQIDGSTISANHAGNAFSTIGNGGDGGGIYNFLGKMTITNSTFYANQSGSSQNASTGSGGGLVNNGGIMDVNNCTISQNQTAATGATYGYGGGIESSTNNTTTKLHNTILALNTNPGLPPGSQAPNCHTGSDAGNIFEARYSLIYGLQGCTPDVGISLITGSNPLLGTFANHGGFTPTFNLEPNSPAIDTGEYPANCPAFDQRGYRRPVNGDYSGTAACDIGAYELQMFRFLPFLISP